MALSDVTLTVIDGALGFSPASSDSVIAAYGVCSLGTAEQLYVLTDPSKIAETIGYGPGAEFCAHVLSQAPGSVVLFVPVDSDVTGSNGSVTNNGTGDGVVGVTGTPLDDYRGAVKITKAGVLGTARFRYALDYRTNADGDTVATWSAEYATAATFALPGSSTGLTLTFADAGSTHFVLGDVHTWESTAPGYTTTPGADARAVILASSREYAGIFQVGEPDDEDDGATLAGVLATEMATAFAAHRYTFAAFGLPAVSDEEDILDAFDEVFSTRLAIACRHVDIVSAISKLVHKRSVLWAAAAEMLRFSLSEDLGQVSHGPLSATYTRLYGDERKTPGLDEAGFITARTYLGIAGNYVTHGRMKTLDTSDYKWLTHRRIMDRACKVSRTRLLTSYLNAKILVSKTTGRILEKEALAIEANVNADLESALVAPTHASGSSVLVNRTDNILSTENLRADVRVIPPGYARAITETIGFFNPALAPT